ncbi:chromosome transmission fidelity protein 18 homolog isoform X3 [Sagmatias obliquidens]|uniref:chromosome transmission fidelity protein 18 homolog isoform X3 n=1 Tax=Sagmatias obliquidens TaxID=3371155 RepID=UPI000F440B9F|nr:chromosome transmission fidelity protein 18 homolog isoform X3 [Lagenorhynchus obliquidens]
MGLSLSHVDVPCPASPPRNPRLPRLMGTGGEVPGGLHCEHFPRPCPFRDRPAAELRRLGPRCCCPALAPALASPCLVAQQPRSSHLDHRGAARWAREVRSRRRAAMEDYEQELYGVEDDFHSQFAAELEVLAELEGTTATSPSRDPWPTVGRPRLTFEETIAGGNAATHCSPGGPPRNSKGGARKRQLAADIHGDRPLPPTPKVKRSRLEAARRLNFRSDEMEEPLPPDSPTQDITPPPSPEVPAELWGKGPLDTGADVGLTKASPAARNPVLRRPPVLEDYINVTSTDGNRAFLVLQADPVGTGVQSPLLDIRWRGRGQLDLLGVSFASLKEKIDSERRQRLLEEAQRLSDTLCSLRSEEVEEGPQPSGASEEEPADSQDASQHCLWVDEFAPQRYTELLSDDVALLCGPPGLGKTTLAHVIARHAGYSVVEMNASDDRSPEAFRTRIEAATQMESVLGTGGRPNCLVIDEIDGAPTAAINVLLSVLDRQGRQEAEPGGPAVPTGGGRRRRAEGGILMRPIICICNDQFVPSLRQLKQQALLLHFPPTLPSRLTQRLQEISLRRGMRPDPGALAALCEKTDNDIRACINALQFLHGRGQRELSVQAVQTTRIGLKDQRKGLFSVWQEVFQLPQARRHRMGQDPTLPSHTLLLGDGHVGSGPLATKVPLTAASQRFYHILHVAASAGEHEKVVQGLFDNFLRLRLRDSSLAAVCIALDWLAFDDLLSRAAHHGQSFQLLRYLPFLPPAFHLLFASSHVPRITFPTSQQEVRPTPCPYPGSNTGALGDLVLVRPPPQAQNRMSRTHNLMQTLVSGITPATRSRAAPQALILDTLCLLLDILAPKLRPVSTQLYSAREKQQLASLVGTMLAYSLTYCQERTPDGQYVYRLEPNVEDVCRFPELPTRKPLTYQAKQLIAREIEVEKMRRVEALARARVGPQVDGGPLGGTGEKGAQPSAPCSHEQRLECILKRAALEEQPERDFFGRVVVKRAAAPSTEHAAPETDTAEQRMGTAVGRSDVWFRFKEGVSNAVRRSLYIRDLL